MEPDPSRRLIPGGFSPCLKVPAMADFLTADDATRTVKVITDTAAGMTAATAPVWATWLSQINTALTTISLIIGIVFLAWRWSRDVRNHKDPLP